MSLKHYYLDFVERLFVAVAKLCLRRSLRLQEVLERLKRAYIIAAREQIEESSGRSTTSKLSVMTGIHRRDIERLQGGGATYDGEESLIAKVIGAWQGKPRYRTASGKLKALTRGEFDELVQSVSKELSPATVLFELERTGVIHIKSLKIDLVLGSYSPSDKIEHGLVTLAADISDLIEGVEENLREENSISNLHARTVFDNVRPEKIKELRAFLVREGHQLHLKARNYLSALDQDLNPDPSFKGRGIKVILGSFSRVRSAGK